jgi:tRNA threonylcarbamoyladenosine biosynthesis protein TsaB
MIRLGVELSLPEGSVSVERDGEIVSQISWNRPKLHAEVVYAKIEEALKLAGAERRDVEEIVVSSGPGSFTGVRLSITVGKAFKATGVKALSASTLDALSYGYERLGFTPVPIIPARRGRVYAKVEEDLADIPLGKLLERVKGLQNPLLIYKGEVGEIPESIKAVKEPAPLSTKLLLMPKNSLSPLTFHYVREHDAKRAENPPLQSERRFGAGRD